MLLHYHLDDLEESLSKNTIHSTSFIVKQHHFDSKFKCLDSLIKTSLCMQFLHEAVFLQIYFCLMISNCLSERLFSVFKRIKN